MAKTEGTALSNKQEFNTSQFHLLVSQSAAIYIKKRKVSGEKKNSNCRLLLLLLSLFLNTFKNKVEEISNGKYVK